ncbi:MAG: FAD binding domain-containing protein [Gemmatimonadota bacterium]
MIPAAFDYHAPASLDEALALLSEHGPGAKVLAGGQSLIPLMRFRLAGPRAVVDLNGVAELARLEESDGALHIGALVRHATIEHTDWIRERYPLLAEAADVIADPLVRNRGTVGGSLAHADPAGDWGSVMLAARAELVAWQAGEERVIPIDDFFLAPFMTALEPEELLTEVRMPRAGPGQAGAYEKLERKVGDFATVGVAVQLSLDDAGICRAAGIGLTAVGPTNLRAARAEAALAGGPPDETRIAEAAALAAEQSQPTADNRGSEEYKRDMVRVLTARALRRAVEHVRGAE